MTTKRDELPNNNKPNGVDTMPKYARRHYEDVAKIINRNLRLSPLDNPKHNAFRDGVNCVLMDFEDLFLEDNPNFDLGKFRKACKFD
jgi:hypothetical protein